MPNQTLVNASQQSTGTISSDGQYVVFESLATDLVPNFVQQNGGRTYGTDLYLRDTWRVRPRSSPTTFRPTRAAATAFPPLQP